MVSALGNPILRKNKQKQTRRMGHPAYDMMSLVEFESLAHHSKTVRIILNKQAGTI
jgi:hypothetical protein